MSLPPSLRTLADHIKHHVRTSNSSSSSTASSSSPPATGAANTLGSSSSASASASAAAAASGASGAMSVGRRRSRTGPDVSRASLGMGVGLGLSGRGAAELEQRGRLVAIPLAASNCIDASAVFTRGTSGFLQQSGAAATPPEHHAPVPRVSGLPSHHGPPPAYPHPHQHPHPRRPASQPLGTAHASWMHPATSAGSAAGLTAHLPRSRSQQSAPLQHPSAGPGSLANSESSHSSLDLPVAVVRSARSCSCPSCGGTVLDGRGGASGVATALPAALSPPDEVFVYPQTPLLSTASPSWHHAADLLRRMEAAWRDGGRLTDVVLLVEDRRIPAHKVILAAASDYFAAMFNCELVEASQREVRITNVDPEAMQSLVEYMYTGELTVLEETVESLLSAACMTQMWRVREICCDFLARQLAASNCLGIRSFAECYGCTELAERSTHFALEHIAEVLRHAEWRQLQLAEVLSLLRSDDLNVESEVAVFQACVDWCEGELAERREFFPQLLSCVRLPLLPQGFLLEVVRPHALIQESVESLRLLVEAFSLHLREDLKAEAATPACRARKAQLGRIWALGGINARHEGTQEIVEFDPRTERWAVVGHLPERRLQFGSAVVNDGALMVVGGRDGLKSLNTALLYSPGKREWLQLSPMATHRHGLGVGVLQAIVYAVGGHDGWSYLNTVERWDPSSRTWAYVSPMSMPRSTVGVAALSGRLYAVGGRDGSSCLRTVEAFDPHTQRWSLCSPLLKRRGGVGVAAAGGCLYAVGGHDAPANNPIARRFDCAECYDPKTDQWTLIASLNSPRESVGLAVLGFRLYALGGCRGQKYSRTVEMYDPNANRWSQTTDLPSPLAGISVAVMHSIRHT